MQKCQDQAERYIASNEKLNSQVRQDRGTIEELETQVKALKNSLTNSDNHIEKLSAKLKLLHTNVATAMKRITESEMQKQTAHNALE